MTPDQRPLWTPSPARVAASQMMAFLAETNRRHGLALSDTRHCTAWSIENRDAFWEQVWDFCEVVGEKGERRVINGDQMPGAQFFPDASLNFAENLLRRDGDGEAMVFRGEDKAASRFTWRQLNELVSRLQQALARRRHRRRRPRCGDDAQPAGNHRAHAGNGLDRRGVVLLFAGFRRARRAGSFRPDRAQAVRGM